MSMKTSRNDLVMCIPKTYASRTLDMPVSIQLNDCSCRLQQQLKGIMAPIKQVSTETKDQKTR